MDDTHHLSPSDIRAIIGSRIRHARRRLGLTQGDLCLAAGLGSTAAVCRLERGDLDRVDVVAVVRVAIALGVEPGDLIRMPESRL